ncbi:MAG: dihydroorotate dehydrogenase electron transfer subunit [Bacteroidales bacterium]|nr:dihydroorotate dehydrogenase electron transfer subunit [Candidatus Physcousia equi]
MKKHILDLKVVEVVRPHERYVMLKLTNPNGALPEMRPGQFAQLRVDGSSTTFLRRPISINFMDKKKNEVWFLVQTVGDGTRQLAKLLEGDTLNVVLPLGNGFDLEAHPATSEKRPLLVGGGVGCAPMLYLGKTMSERGVRPYFLIGARTKGDLLQLELFAQYGDVYVTTEDGSAGEKGFVTQHTLLRDSGRFSEICCCGPKPMMMAVARYAQSSSLPCAVSLENKMACGVGACLCCVEDTQEGHVCVCSDGPVFPIEQLKWNTRP